jgi:sigma-B regulation protein RsbU (phosphoserine phosphatase)
MFATAFVAVLDPATGSLDYVNAGHEPPAIVGSGGVRARLQPTGPALGLMPALPFGVQSERLAAGETLLAYTDGVVDARDPADGPFGEERLMELLHQDAASAELLLERIDAALSAHITTAPQFDDVAMLATRRTT